MTRIACIGEAMIELSTRSDHAQLGVAGDTLNTAIYLKRSAPDLSVDYMTCLGDDPFSARILDFINTQNIGTDNIQTISGMSPGLYAITTTPEGERSFTYWRSAAAARQLFANGDFSRFGEYDALYLSGISLAILPQDVRRALLDWLNASDVQVIYDSNFRPSLWDSVENAQSMTQAMWARADIALPSIDDEMALFEESAERVMKRFKQHRGQGALKRGAEGPMSIGSEIDQPYAGVSAVVDTTAAGDSFNGGYLGAYLSGQSQARALQAGHELAARVIQHRGAIIPE